MRFPFFRRYGWLTLSGYKQTMSYPRQVGIWFSIVPPREQRRGWFALTFAPYEYILTIGLSRPPEPGSHFA
jgi:hypothetical protein